MISEQGKRLLDSLNEEQRQAVLEYQHPLLVLAGAGSGKTRVITTKIAYFISELGCDPRSILAVTFTNKAAREMKERLENMSPGADRALIKTFHAFGAWMLRRFAHEAGLSQQFTIYDDEDMVSVLHSSYPDFKRKELKPFAKWISRAKDYCLSPDDDLKSITVDPRFPGMYRRYEEKMRSIGNVDFGDLIMKPVELLERDAEVRRAVTSRFRVVLVDEYQDSNAAQFRLLKALYTKNTFVCVVGDDDQSIYRFRGAEIENILTFDQYFPDTRIIALEQNYRSTGTILKIASEVVKNNSGRHKKVLRTEREMGKKAHLEFFEDQFAEAQFAAELAVKDHRYDDTAILYRTNAQSAAFETVFMRMHVPYKIIGALKFYDREEIKDALALLSLYLNSRDEIAFRRVINKPTRGIGASSVERILSCAGEYRGDCLAGLEHAELKGKARKGSEEFLSCFRHTSELLEAGDLSVFIQEVLKSFGLIEHYRQQDLHASTQKINNLEELVNAISRYQDGRQGLTAFMESLELDPTTVGSHDPSAQPGITLITMHNTKGLEFDRVIISGMEEGLFPGRMSESDEDIEEERRIFYVSITRARDELYLTGCRRRSQWGKVTHQLPSRFLEELPKDQVQQVRAAGSLGISSASSYGVMPAGPQKRSSFARQVISDRKSDPVSAGKFTRGDRVFHDSYGSGYILSSRIEQGREVVEVSFDTGKGKMQFIAKYTPLEKIAND